MDVRQKAVGLAQEYRAFWNENPSLAIGIGFVPIVGSLVGVADAVAAGLDPEADRMEKGLAAAGILPYGKAGAALKALLGVGGGGAYLGMTLGTKGIRAMEKAGRQDELINRRFDNIIGSEVAEIVDPSTINPAAVKKADAANAAIVGPARVAFKNASWTGLDPYQNLDVVIDPKRVAGSGSAWPASNSPQGRPKMSVGTFGTSGGRHMDEVEKAAGHEVGHVTADVEGWTHLTGANPDKHGWAVYRGRGGEHLAEVDAQRKNWNRAQYETIHREDHQRGFEKAVEMAIKTGDDPRRVVKLLEDPAIARQFAAREAAEGVDPNIRRAWSATEPNWDRSIHPDVDAGEWGGRLKWDELVDLDPDGQMKLTNAINSKQISPIGTTSASGSKLTNWSRRMQHNEPIPPVVVSVRRTSNGWEVADVDGVRRAAAARHMYGRNAEVRVIYRPVDEASKKVARSSTKTRSLPMAPDRVRKMADNLQYWHSGLSQMTGGRYLEY